MRTFHIGGAAQRGAEQSELEAAFDGKVDRSRTATSVQNSRRPCRSSWPQRRDACCSTSTGRERARHRVPYGARLLVDDGAKVERGDPLAEWDPVHPADHHRAGRHRALRRSGRRHLDARGRSTRPPASAIEGGHRLEAAAAGSDLRPRITLRDEKGEVVTLANGLEARYFLSVDAILSVENGAAGPGRRRPGPHSARIDRRPATSPAACRASPSCSRRASRRISRSSARSTAAVEFGKDYKTKRRIVVDPTTRTRSRSST